MRFALALAALVFLANAAVAGSPTPAATNRVGCKNPQDLIDFMRLMQQAKDNEQLSTMVLSQFMAKLSSGTCHQFTKGTPIFTDKQETIQDIPLDCIRDERSDVCSYALTPKG